MNYLFEKSRYPHNPVQYKIEKLERDFKTLALNHANNNDIEEFKARATKNLDLYRKQLKGFNLWGFLFGVVAVHTTLLFTRRTMLYELPLNQYLLHLGMITGAGIAVGTFVGNAYARDLKTYKKLNRFYRQINKKENN
jgi:hypothetical protein